jgi:hypothetical protein
MKMRTVIPRLALAAVPLVLAGIIAAREVGLTTPGSPQRRALRNFMGSLLGAGAPAAYAQNQAPAMAPLTIYADGLAPGWEDWSWAKRRLDDESGPARGKRALAMVPEGFRGIFLHHAPFNAAGYHALEFLFRGEAPIEVALADRDDKYSGAVPLARYLRSDPSLPPGWKAARIPLADLGLARLGGFISGVVFQAMEARPYPEVFFDEIRLVAGSAPAQPSSDRSVPEVEIAVSIDPGADRRPISPLIYGMSLASATHLHELRLGSNRWGGNAKTRYNWELGNASSAARDWRWANKISDPEAGHGVSSAVNRFHQLNTATGAVSLVTVPTIGWVAKDHDNNSYSINVPEDGGPPLPGTDGAIPGYDPTENRRRTSIPSFARKPGPFANPPDLTDGKVYQDEWIAYLVGKFGPAEKGGIRLYAMDNEPDLWSSTHTDIRPARLGYDDLLSIFLEYAAAVKAVDPTAQITGPVSWGWTGYEYSPLDQGDDNYRTHADRKRHGNLPFLRWFLQSVRAHDQRTGKRTLDVLDVHFYPQGRGLYPGENTISDPDRERRLRSTRGLWDASYVDESWIREPVRLLPRLREHIEAAYPGTRIGITEWNFGAERDISGGLATAEALGIFGREGVYIANYWTYPPPGSPAYLAFKLLRNPDGTGKGFGETSCRAASTAPDRVSVYAASEERSGAITLLLINKQAGTAARVPITVRGTEGRRFRGQATRLAAAQPDRLQPVTLPDVLNGTVAVTLPPFSATLVRLTPEGTAR